MARITTVGELAASIAHEVNQPLGAVVADAGACLLWLQHMPPNTIEGVAAAKRIMEQAVRASEVVSRIRSLIKKDPPQKLIVQINDMVTDVLSLTRNEILTHNITLQTELSNDLLPVRGDPVQLKQVLANLVLNAIEAMHANREGARHLLVASRNDGRDRILVSVRDSGPGLDPDIIEELFKPFVTNKPDGLGMGLAISRSIIEAHGGRLWATVNDDTGATFQFSLSLL
jgi:C4-dicarboxylate-specific signal transduction histidine kinase